MEACGGASNAACSLSRTSRTEAQLRFAAPARRRETRRGGIMARVREGRACAAAQEAEAKVRTTWFIRRASTRQQRRQPIASAVEITKWQSAVEGGVGLGDWVREGREELDETAVERKLRLARRRSKS
eukprot:3546060-Pleurochrysis_carterae.AAC.1